MSHHAFVIEAEAEKGIEMAEEHAKSEGISIPNNPDVITLRYRLLSVEDARRISDVVSQAPLTSERKAVIIAASRMYHEAQNALLKVFEEPPQGTCVYLILPSLGSLLPTLRSRVHVLRAEGRSDAPISETAEAFLQASKEKRTALIKKLTSGKDEEERRENRDEALAIVNGVETIAYKQLHTGDTGLTDLLREIATLRNFLTERSAPVRMILEHLSLVLPKGLR